MKNKDYAGPDSYAYKRQFSQNAEKLGAIEFPLYSDAYVTGSLESKFSPYCFENHTPLRPRYADVRPVLLLRILSAWITGEQELDLEELFSRVHQRNLKRHTGSISDELVSILSLGLGVRLKSGSMIREFNPHFSQYGRHIFGAHKPAFSCVPGELPRMPCVIGPVSIDSARPLLSAFFKSPPKRALDILRTARLHQEALWLVESLPDLAWLLLVSAVEVAASELRRCKGPERKFRHFLMKYVPKEPQKRPSREMQVSWKSLEDKFTYIYSLRSNILHKGEPFPPYMCAPALQHESWAAPAEIVVVSDKPDKDERAMTLHIFEYIVRGSLLNWATSPQGSASEDGISQ